MQNLEPKFLLSKDPWMLGEDIPDIDFFFSQIWLSCFVNEFAQLGGRAYRNILAVYRGYHLWFYYGTQDAYDVGESLARKIVTSPSFAQQINREIVETSDRLRTFCETLPETGWENISNTKLWEWYEEHDVRHTAYYQWGWLPVAADMFHANLTESLKAALREHGVADELLNEYFVTLTQPASKSLIQIQHEELMQLVAHIQADPFHTKLFAGCGAKSGGIAELLRSMQPAFLRALEAYHATYLYVNHMWVGFASTLEDTAREVCTAFVEHPNAAQTLIDEQKEWKANLERREKIFQRVKLEARWKTVFEEFGGFMVTKIYRRYAQLYAVYKMEFLQKEIARRLDLSLMQVRFLLPQEMKAALLDGQLDRRELQKRTKMCVYYAEKGVDQIFMGPEAEELATGAEKVEIGDVSELKGQTGCLGKGRGIVKIVIRPSDMEKMQQGDILVSIATDPDIVPAMKKAAAIITEQGGVTSHAAIVSRELNIPCVIGTKVATKVLKDGDEVEVDADKGTVTVLKRVG